MGIFGNELTLFVISMLGHRDHLDSLERKIYTKNTKNWQAC